MVNLSGTEPCMSKIEAEVVQLRTEIQALKALLTAHGIELPQPPDAEAAVHAIPELSVSSLSKDAKVKLFRRLFHGRDDVYPVRWQNQNTGKSGYSPACANLWRPVICKKSQGLQCVQPSSVSARSRRRRHPPSER